MRKANQSRNQAHFVVIAGLDPAIHQFAKKVDAQVKSGHDVEGLVNRRRWTERA